MPATLYAELLTATSLRRMSFLPAYAPVPASAALTMSSPNVPEPQYSLAVRNIGSMQALLAEPFASLAVPGQAFLFRPVEKPFSVRMAPLLLTELPPTLYAAMRAAKLPPVLAALEPVGCWFILSWSRSIRLCAFTSVPGT